MGIECAKPRSKETSVTLMKKVKSPSKLRTMEEHLSFALDISDLEIHCPAQVIILHILRGSHRLSLRPTNASRSPFQENSSVSMIQ